MASLPDSLVKTYLTPAARRESPELNLDCGVRQFASLANYDQDSHCWRTSQPCLGGESVEFLETWPRSGMTRNGRLYPLPMSGRPISESESGFWPTPDVRGFTNEGGIAGLARKCDSYEEMDRMAYRGNRAYKDKYWPTPTSSRRSGLQSHGKNAILGRLNPVWLEWLMGYPAEWTAFDAAETP